MGLKQEFLAALRAGTSYQGLMELVRVQQAQGMTPEIPIRNSKRFWLEYGFDKEVDDGPLQNNLEAVMQKVWYGSPV